MSSLEMTAVLAPVDTSQRAEGRFFLFEQQRRLPVFAVEQVLEQVAVDGRAFTTVILLNALKHSARHL